MKKKKYLHRKGKDDKKWKTHNNRTKKIYGKDEPFRESIRNKHKDEGRYYWNWDTGLDFTPVACYIDENLNRNWSEVYSEIITKVKPRNRWQLEKYLSWHLADTVFYNYIPYFKSYPRPVVDSTFIDEDNILRKYSSLDELKSMSEKRIRKEKLLKLQEIENE